MASLDSSAENYLNNLNSELQMLDPQLHHSKRLLQQEMDRVRNEPDASRRSDNQIVVHTGKEICLKVKAHIPVDENPDFNFVGKLLGPKGSSLQQLQEATQTKMAILGRGSMRDKKTEEELRTQGDAKYGHLNEDLHVEIYAYATPQEAYKRISRALRELQRLLVPDNNPPFNQGQSYYPFMNDGRPKPPFPPGEGPPHMAPRGGPPHPPRRTGMVQSTYVSLEADQWASSRPIPPRRGGYHSATLPAHAARPDEEPVSDYNSYGDVYEEYNSGNAASYYNYAVKQEPIDDGYFHETALY